MIDKLTEDLLKVRVETFDGQAREISGEFVEPIHLQVVCQRLWHGLMNCKVDDINQEYIGHAGDVNNVLKHFYIEAVFKASKITGISEDIIRNWIEEKLITGKGTRDNVLRGSEKTDGIPNKVLDILENNYVIRRMENSGALWYQLTHDRLIKPIKESNEERRYIKSKMGFRKYLSFGKA
jgi:hypothetical protein